MPDEQIQPAVAVDVDERRRHAPARVACPADRGHIGEGAVAVVLEQLVVAELCDVQVDAAVVVEVAGRDAHSVAVASMPLSSVTSVKCRPVPSGLLQIVPK